MERHILITLLLLLSVQGTLHSTVGIEQNSISTTSYIEGVNDDNINMTTTLSTPIQLPPANNPVDCSNTSGWSQLSPEECGGRIFVICNLQVSMLEAQCICTDECPTDEEENDNADIDCDNNRDQWIHKGFEDCLNIVFVVCELDMQRAEYMCLCAGKCNKTTEELDNININMTTPARLPPANNPVDCSNTSGWSQLSPEECGGRIFRICKLQVSMLEAQCICTGKCSTDEEETDNADIDCDNNRDQWIHKGFEDCLNIVFKVCDLDMRRTEYMCLCDGKCNKTIEELNDLHFKEAADKAREQDKEHYIVKGVVYGVIFILGVFGNLLVIITITKFMGRTTVTNIYICNLAVADLVVILINVPTKAIESIYLIWKLGETACKITVWLYFASFMWSVFTLMCMSLERYMVINHPMKAQMLSSFKRTAVIVVCIWILGAALSMPAFFLAEEQQNNVCTIASFDFEKKLIFYSYIFAAIFVVPCVLMSFAYIRTSITLWKSVKKQQQMKHNADSKAEKTADTSGRVQVIRILIGVLVVFIVCWAPYLSLQVYSNTDHSMTNIVFKFKQQDIQVWLNFLSLANSALNPILYGLLSRQFRMGFLRCLTCKRKGMEPSKSYITSTGGLTTMTSRQTTTAIPMKSNGETPQKNGEIPDTNGTASNPAVSEADNKL